MTETVCQVIRLARKEAGISQEAAAPKLFLSVRQLKSMEHGITSVDPATIGRMADLYHKPMLALQYVNACAQAAGMGAIIPADCKPLPLTAMQLVNRIYRFADKHRDRQLLTIAEDGVVDETEQEAFEQILDELAEIIQLAQCLRYLPEMGGAM
jgi:transcriptional regulator with XRE-family HTH domain